MGKPFTAINESARRFIESQRIFFVASAPLSREGHVNLSPKGQDTFRILGETTVAYLDLTGSGIETVSHLRENARITLMFCSFEGPPKILRIYGRGRAVQAADTEFATLLAHFPEHVGTRSIVVVEIRRIADSCGYSIPLFRYEGDRNQLTSWATKRGPEGLAKYRDENNRNSIDGLAGLRTE